MIECPVCQDKFFSRRALSSHFCILRRKNSKHRDYYEKEVQRLTMLFDSDKALYELETDLFTDATIGDIFKRVYGVVACKKRAARISFASKRGTKREYEYRSH